MGSRADRKLRELDAKRLKQARLVEETFSTEAGKQTWAMLQGYYDQDMRPGREGELDFKAGQRDVVRQLMQYRAMAKAKEHGAIPDPMTQGGE